VSAILRVVIADDERPARSYLAALLRGFGDVTIVGEAENGAEAVELIEGVRPDLALLDLQMPELDGLGVVRLVSKSCMPLVAFVTAYDEFAVKAFELNAIDYLLKPIDRVRLRDTLDRAQERLERAESPGDEAERLRAAGESYDESRTQPLLERLPVRHRGQIILVPVRQIASIVAEGELLHLTTVAGDRHTITYRLKDLEARLDPAQFLRLGRGAIVNIEMIDRLTPMPGGTYVVTLTNKQQLSASRSQSRLLRETLLRL
jgi:two-component system LytT family response regulator